MMTEETLDPQDWEGLKALGHRMMDEALDRLRTLRDQPVWQRPPASVRAHLRQPLPSQPEAVDRIYEDFRENVMPYPTGNIHPRFWGWVMGTGTPLGMLAEMLAAGLNSNAGDFDDGPSLVEDQVLAWLKEMMGYPEWATGLLVSGGSMANLVGLTVARNSRAGFDVRKQGLGAAPRPLTLYASQQVHSSVRKAVELLGLGSDALHAIPVDDEYRIQLPALQSAIAADRGAGLRPFCVVGCAGTANTGAIDDLKGLAALCATEDLWLHVDGAFGALAALAPGLRPRLEGMATADSLAFDLHKWGYFPIEVGCTLVRSGEAHRRAFATAADYLASTSGGIANRSHRLSEHGPQLTRGFRALKVWMGLKEHGVAKLGRLIQQNVDQAAYLARLVTEHPDLELMAPVSLNIVCFRYRGRGIADLDGLNRRILIRLQESGVAAPSFTTLHGRFVLRVAVTNHRSRREDFDLLVGEVVRLGNEAAEARDRNEAANG